MRQVVNVKETIGGFDFAGSRGSGETIRETIEPVLEAGGSVTLDFAGVEMITQSFADEIFGVIVRARGIDHIKGKLLINNYNEEIRSIINTVISYSRKRGIAA